MTYQENMVKDAEAESGVLRKRLREVEGDFQRFQKLLGESLATRQSLEEKVNDLKHFLIMAGAGSSKLE